jgi:hypothetical protein
MAENVEFGQKLTNNTKKNQMGMILYPPKSGCSVTVRFVGVQQKLYQKWNTITKKFACSERSQEGYITRVVSFVIDRADGKVKAFLCPISVFDQLGQYGPTHDFKVNREGIGLNTKYQIESLGETEVTQDFLDRIEITAKVHTLSDIFINGAKWTFLDADSKPIDDRFEIMDL